MDVSMDNIRGTIEELCKFKHRTAGTEAEKEAADYLKGVLSEIGFEVIEHSFPVISWEPKEAAITLLSPEDRSIECELFPNSPSVEQKAILVGIESKRGEESKEMPVYGIAEWGENLYASPNNPYNKALDRNLDGLIISSPDDGKLMKVRVGDHGKQLQIPIFSVSKETGELLNELIEESEVIMEIKSVAKRSPSSSCNLEAVIEGKNPDFDIIISAHYDAWFSGASDNAAPVAIVVEVARHMLALSQQHNAFRRTIRFLFYGAEESGSERFYYWLNGSRNYVESQENLEKFALVVNLDSIGYDATNYVATTYELLSFAQEMITATNQEERFSYYSPPADGSDHWFFTIGGVPTIYLISWPSPLYHTQKDIPEALDFESIHAYTEYILDLMKEFSNAKLLPLDMMTSIEFIRERVNEISNIEGNPFEFQEVSNLLDEIIEYKKALQKLSRNILKSDKNEDFARINEFLLTSVAKLNRTIGRVGGWHEAKYLSRLEFTQEFIMIESVVRKLEEMPLMKIHPRTLANLEDYEDTSDEMVHIANAILMLKNECDELALKINEEIKRITHSLREILTDLKTLLTIASE